jgi:hypothetical protein
VWQFIANDNCAIEFQDITLYLLIYADDMILMSKSVEGLQNMLNTLYNYTIKWGLSVNIKKTKIVVFRQGGNIRPNEAFHHTIKYYIHMYQIDFNIVNIFKHKDEVFFLMLNIAFLPCSAQCF